MQRLRVKNHFLTETLESNDSIQAKQSFICDATLVMQELVQQYRFVQQYMLMDHHN
jgi:hypothetical protein